MPAAADYAHRAAVAGEDEVRFNPSDLGSWQRWTLGLASVADEQFARGEITGSIVTRRALVALEKDPRVPSSLGPIVWFRWVDLAFAEAEMGDIAAATASVAAFKRGAGEYVAQLNPDDARHKLLSGPEQGINGAIQLIAGSFQEAFDNASAMVKRTEAVEIAKDDLSGNLFKNDILRGNLETAARAAIHLGRHHEAEMLARKWLDVPVDDTSETDWRSRRSRASAVLAHALALQGRSQEAIETLGPALDYYREEQRAGATSTDFRADFAYALTVDAIARSDNVAERAHRDASLDGAQRLLDGASTEAKRMATYRQIADLIATTRG